MIWFSRRLLERIEREKKIKNKKSERKKRGEREGYDFQKKKRAEFQQRANPKKNEWNKMAHK